MDRNINKILSDQATYYQRRAGEYDEWFLRQGRYDRGPENNSAWFADLEIIKKTLCIKPLGDTLEIAGGTGLWTSLLKGNAKSVHVLDSSEEVLAINKMKNPDVNITYEVGDVFNWSPDRKYDFIFFSFWLSHVPEEKFLQFWDLIYLSLKDNGRWFFIDSKSDEFSRAIDHTIDLNSDVVIRKLNDGTEFNIIKRFYDVKGLSDRLKTMGWTTDLSSTHRFFIFGSGYKNK
ncbi:MAG: class I SAM-dependent methyltransferase [Pseudobdellovibrionaceae bacterium]